MLWLKTFHIVFMVTWFAGLFYLPRLFVYHAQSEDSQTRTTLRTMQRKLMVMTHIGGVATLLFGVLLLIDMPMWLTQGWLHWKLALVLALVVYHLWCLRLVKALARGENHRSHVWYRWFNEVPILLLIAIVALAVLKPF